MRSPFFLPLVSLLLLPLVSCGSSSDVLDSISDKIDDLMYSSDLKLGDDSYVRGFYNEELLYNIYEKSAADVVEEKDNRVYYQPPHSSLKLLTYTTTRNDSPKENPLYCLETQKAAATSYYADGSAHWIYYCGTGTDQTDRVVRKVTGADAAKFDALITFCRNNCYEPFNAAKNSGIKTVSFPMPDGRIPEVVFYKKSDDGLLSSCTNDALHILEGKLYLAFTYDFDRQHDGRYAKIEAVALPDTLEPYFRSLARSYGL